MIQIGWQRYLFALAIWVSLFGTLTYGQTILSVGEVSKDRSKLDKKVIAVRGVLLSGHMGNFLEDQEQKIAIRLRFEDPRHLGARQRVTKDDLYRQLFGLTNRILPASEQRTTYTVDLECFVSVVVNRSINLNRESPIEVYPLRVLQISPSAP